MALVCPPYFAIVGFEYGAFVALWRRFKRYPEDLLTCAIPNFAYLFLQRISERQGFYMVHAAAIIALAVGLLLPIKGLFAQRRALAALAIIAFGSATAFISWRVLPLSNPDWFQNAGGVW
jgi:hypothetical protein